MLKNILIVLFLISSAALGLSALTIAKLRAEVNEYKQRSEELSITLDRDRKALQGYQEAHQRDARSLAALDRKIQELQDYVSKAENSDAECLSPDDTERLRRLWD